VDIHLTFIMSKGDRAEGMNKNRNVNIVYQG